MKRIYQAGYTLFELLTVIAILVSLTFFGAIVVAIIHFIAKVW